MLLTILILLTFGILANATAGPVVKISDGFVEGVHAYSRNQNKYIAFEGIPYAKPPISNLRFEPPEPIDPWPGVIKSRFPNTCLQFPHTMDLVNQKAVGHEDCLYISVYTPKLDSSAKLSVIVNIHGGAFMFGSGIMAGPSYLMDRDDFIYVNLHYRLGPLGFLSTENNVVPGNNGLKDQLLALKWVQKNIHYFGGDPKEVTIVGCSAGGASVHFHLLSPLSKGLFKNAFSMSGSALVPWAMSEGNLERAKKLASNVGCNNDNIEKMVQCMKLRPGTQIVEQVNSFLEYLYLPLTPFGVVVEKGSLQPFLNQHPKDMLKSGKINDVPWLTSILENEGLYPVAQFSRDENHFKYLEENWNSIGLHLLEMNYTVPNDLKQSVLDSVKKFYFKNKPISKDIFSDIVDMISDRWFSAGIVEAIQLQSMINKSPIYLYKFNYRGEISLTNFLTGTKENFGASHGDDQYYIFSVVPELSEKENKMIEFMSNILISFAKTGKPEIKNVDWKPVCFEPKTISYLDIKSPTNFSMVTNNHLGHLEFWKSLPIED